MIKKQKIELLAPAGDFECLAAAINAGADAIYFGLSKYNMRERAKNFKINDLKKIYEICERKKIKKYLALNTIIYDNELLKIEKIIKKAKRYIDAIICSDISVMLICKKYKIPFHVSTQCSVSNTKTAKFFKKLGASRIVLARELNLSQVSKIAKVIPVELFIHGAMCVSISGRCLISQFLFKESANRGRCLHPCRRYYIVKDNEGNTLKVENNYIFSAKDLCTLPFIERLKKSGAISFKIEGRSKEPEYVATVVKVYRRALDNRLSNNEINELMNELKKVYNKGYSSGFYLGIPTNDDFSRAEHSSGKESKQFLGKIKHYYNKINVGVLKLNTGKLKINDEILIIGKTTGVIRHKVDSMQINHVNVDVVSKGEEVGLKIPFCRKGDEVYKVIVKN
ncbi:MAG: U32 family peptidase [Candidatus Pacearchaeota archaeon]